MYRLFFLLFLFFLAENATAQPDFYDGVKVTTADTLRGKLRAERTCYDVGHYDLTVELNILAKAIKGENKITYRIVHDFKRLQIDLFENMIIDQIVHDGQELDYQRVEGAVFIDFSKVQKVSQGVGILNIKYHGAPKEAVNPPWDGGFTWTKDAHENDWIVVSCEGIGASLWWPNKDHLSDEPDSMDIRLIVPEPLMAVGNGKLVEKLILPNHRQQFHWHIAYPINNYNVTLNVAQYAHFQAHYVAQSGDSLDLDYYVLPENLEKAKKHFEMVPEMLGIYESYLGQFPFWRDGYALVETPTLGMEHQGAISYGNKYKRGYLGGRIPKDMNWDYIIVHESAHEYWGNSVSCNDLAEMWLHEGFTTYMEALYVEKRFGYDRSIEYLLAQKEYIQDAAPIQGRPDVNFTSMYSTDKYYKGSWMLHSLRNTIGNDSVWFGLLKGFYQKYKRSNVTTEQWITFVNEYTGTDYRPFFRQYLKYKNPPKLLYSVKKKCRKLIIKYKWDVDVKDFSMPIKLGYKKHYIQVNPSATEWQTITLRRKIRKKFNIDLTSSYFKLKEIK